MIWNCVQIVRIFRWVFLKVNNIIFVCRIWGRRSRKSSRISSKKEPSRPLTCPDSMFGCWLVKRTNFSFSCYMLSSSFVVRVLSWRSLDEKKWRTWKLFIRWRWWCMRSHQPWPWEIRENILLFESRIYFSRTGTSNYILRNNLISFYLL